MPLQKPTIAKEEITTINTSLKPALFKIDSSIKIQGRKSLKPLPFSD